MTAHSRRFALGILVLAAVLSDPNSGRAAQPYSAPVIRDVEVAFRDRAIEITFRGVFHSGAKTATATCEPFVKDLQLPVEVLLKPLPADELESRRNARPAEGASILLPPFTTGAEGVNCVFALTDEEPSSSPAAQRTSTPRRVHIVADFRGPDDEPQRVCGEDEQLGPKGLPIAPAAVTVVGDIVYVNTMPPESWLDSASAGWNWWTRYDLYASDFDLFAIHRDGRRQKLTVDVNDFSTDKMPLSIGIVTDASGSMRDLIGDRQTLDLENLTKRGLAEQAALRVLSTALQAGRRKLAPKDPDDPFEKPRYDPLSNAFILNFNDELFLDGERNPAASARHFTQDETRLRSWITGGSDGGGVILRGGTRLLDAVYRAAYELNRVSALGSCNPDLRLTQMRSEMESHRSAEGRSSYTYQENYQLKHLIEEVATVKRRRVLFAISDGVENASQKTLESVIDYLSKSGLVLYGINYGKNAAEVRASVLPKLAEATGGHALAVNLAGSAESVEEQVEAFTSRVVASIENQYELTFEETLDTCAELAMHAYDTSRVRRNWLELEKAFKRKTCQLESATGTAKPGPKPTGDSTPTITGSEQAPACVPDPHATLPPWSQYYAERSRDQDLPRIPLTHRKHIGNCTPAEIHAIASWNRAQTAPTPNRKKK